MTILPLADLERAPRVVTAQEDLIFRGNACDRRVIVRYLDVVDPSGARTGFSISGGGRGIRISPAAGVTPATVQIEVDPTAYMNQKGTVAVPLEIRSSAAVNLAPAVRLLINTREPEQRGAVISVPGKLVDMLADPVRDRVYVIRQDRNQVLVLNGSTFETIQTLSTGNTPTQMAMTLDNRYLLIGADNSQIAHVYDLETLEQSQPIIFPPGHYPRSIAVSNRSILASVRSSASPEPKIDRIDFDARIATELPSLGIFKNVVHVDTVLMASPSGGTVIAAMPDGNVLLYDASADAFIAARKDLAALSGALMAVSDQTFLVDNNILNASLVPEATLEIGTGTSSGFVVVDGEGVRTTMQSSSGPGVIQRLNLSSLDAIRPTAMIEAPITPKTVRTPNVGQIGQTILPFMRTLAPLSNRAAIASLTTSGLAVLPWNFDAALARPSISSMVNTADATPRFAPGSLVTIYGAELSALTAVNSEMPVPTTLGETCLTVNGALMPMFMASPDRMTAQLPFSVSGPAQVVIRAPGGTSDPFRINISPGAPAVFRNGAAGETTGISTIIRSTNEALVTLSNPIHPEDEIVIYLTGLGQTSPGLEAGEPAPSPAALATVPPEVALGRTPLEIRFAGLSPGLVGVYQINAKVPYWVSTGLEVPLTVTQAGSSTSVSVRVVK